MSAWSLLYSPAVLPVNLQPVQNAPLPSLALQQKIRGFGNALEPRYIFGAGPLDQ
jgi:hypothetical protein